MCNLFKRQSAPQPGDDHLSLRVGQFFQGPGRRQGVQPVASVDDMVRPGLFDSDQELDEFLADLYASRRAGLA